MKTYRAVIVEDRKDNVIFLEKGLKQNTPQIKVVAVCATVAKARIEIRRLKPDLIFLDVELPDGNGFDLLRDLEDMRFKVIFVTQFKQYMLDALRASAIDFLKKPYTLSDLAAASERGMAAVENSPERLVREELQNLLKNLNGGLVIKSEIHLRNMEGTHPVKLDEIVFLKADNNQTIFHLKGKDTITVTQKIGEFEEMLNSHGFVQIHKSYIINLYEIKLYKHRSGDIFMKGWEKPLSVPLDKKKWFDELYDNLDSVSKAAQD